ncbi:mycothiol system anti-sigma-R factor [uncultured Rothia sp.]|uniref:mycothiol system anti-sigma-R factor n=1 Tax=uncultured Rothia sp. TaxID=316088 RepID=UPI002805ECF9|nr:mycothiol system anti-sigma-R factor [uncultured Rothia sp.]
MSSTDKNSSVPELSEAPEAAAASEPLEDCGGQPCSSTLKHLYEFLDRELSPEQLRTIQAHLNACPECADVKDFELMVREKMRSSCAQQAPEQLKARLLQDVQKFCAGASL